MEVFGFLAFAFALFAIVRVEKLIKMLKEKGILDSGYKEN